MRILRSFISFAATLVFLSAAAAPAAAQDALLIVAHGARQPEWNERVIRLAEQVDWPGPVGVAFLMNAAPEHRLDTVAARLDAAGAERIIVLPLLVSSFSGHYEEIRYYVGERTEAPHHAHYQPLRTRARLVLAPAMDDHEVITRILADQVRAISSNPADESVVLVAHGPNEDSDNRLWLERLGHHAERLQKQFGFRRVEALTLRDDAPKPIRDAATEHLRSVVSRFGQDSRVLVLPVLISVGHIQKQIHERLAGLAYTMSEAGLAEHPLAAEWVRQQAASVISSAATDGRQQVPEPLTARNTEHKGQRRSRLEPGTLDVKRHSRVATRSLSQRPDVALASTAKKDTISLLFLRGRALRFGGQILTLGYSISSKP